MEKEKARRQAEQEAEELKMTIKVSRNICGMFNFLFNHNFVSCSDLVLFIFSAIIMTKILPCERKILTDELIFAFQIQSWWRGVMVRRQLGPYSKKKKKKGKKGKKSGKKGKKKK